MSKINEVLHLKFNDHLFNKIVTTCLKFGCRTNSDIVTRFKTSQLPRHPPEYRAAHWQCEVLVSMRGQAFHYLMMRLQIPQRLNVTIKQACRIDHRDGYASLLLSKKQLKVSINLWNDHRAISENDILIHRVGKCDIFCLPVAHPLSYLRI